MLSEALTQKNTWYLVGFRLEKKARQGAGPKDSLNKLERGGFCAPPPAGRPSVHEQAAVDGDVGAGDVGLVVGGEKRDR